ncbi:probable LRR receptor-like serine/threonine-protein kinase At3g47570 [Gossypium hirsutum]|uniref:Probable LRR receptor-like serine/threonine-protein kinase At3g47570 n=1 Tax=Gossypium hirsutum TaxID=3635 RepID=A0ABM3AUG7_GOSHI|nr:probable LRR receptor-like serine/threonine-protein kinase At3g47570 [Gossypium hirsutum]
MNSISFAIVEVGQHLDLLHPERPEPVKLQLQIELLFHFVTFELMFLEFGSVLGADLVMLTSSCLQVSSLVAQVRAELACTWFLTPTASIQVFSKTPTGLLVRGNDTDQQALLQFKAKITDDQLRVMESWNSSIHFCQWHGVTCGHKHQRVNKLKLQFLKLSGSLSPFIGNLSFLKELNLSGNSFYNQIPQEVGHLRRLEILDLSSNSISGEIPPNLSSCSKLKIVRMGSNQLTGEIPSFLGFLSNLKVLSFYNNGLRGSIPPSLGNLSSLEKLALSYNALDGIIPETLAQLTNLSSFLAAANAISGTVPVAMFNLSNIRFFDIGVNKIQGTLYTDLAITMPYVEFFSVRGNKISGQIPISITNASNLHVLQFNDNRLSGKVPSLEKLDKLSTLQLAVNDLGHGREGDLNFLCTLVNNTKLEFLIISD